MKRDYNARAVSNPDINIYQKNRYKVGDEIVINERLCTVKNIYDKGTYNLYLCKDKVFGWSVTKTDKD